MLNILIVIVLMSGKAVIFGDPDDGDAVGAISASKTKVICHEGDNICQHGDLILIPHLTVSHLVSFLAQKLMIKQVLSRCWYCCRLCCRRSRVVRIRTAWNEKEGS